MERCIRAVRAWMIMDKLKVAYYSFIRVQYYDIN